MTKESSCLQLIITSMRIKNKCDLRIKEILEDLMSKDIAE